MSATTRCITIGRHTAHTLKTSSLAIGMVVAKNLGIGSCNIGKALYVRYTTGAMQTKRLPAIPLLCHTHGLSTGSKLAHGETFSQPSFCQATIHAHSNLMQQSSHPQPLAGSIDEVDPFNPLGMHATHADSVISTVGATMTAMHLCP